MNLTSQASQRFSGAETFEQVKHFLEEAAPVLLPAILLRKPLCSTEDMSYVRSPVTRFS